MEKEKLIQRCIENIQEKLNDLQVEFDSLHESLHNETKSSVGDKYETGRSMIHAEIQKNQHQKFEWLEMLNTCKQIFPVETNRVELGSFVQTHEANYLVAIGLGVLKYEGQNVYVISPGSPLGRALWQKKVGDQFEINGKKQTLINVR
ncbi:MAG: GreA/GreB family elongation factor [Lutimonas sp.]